MVTFLGGDPEQPIVIEAVNNLEHRSLIINGNPHRPDMISSNNEGVHIISHIPVFRKPQKTSSEVLTNEQTLED